MDGDINCALDESVLNFFRKQAFDPGHRIRSETCAFSPIAGCDDLFDFDFQLGDSQSQRALDQGDLS
jgi:hypothetical protein